MPFPTEPRPIEQQRWRRHHTGRTAAGVDFFDEPTSPTSGCQRRRRKAIERRRAQGVLSLGVDWRDVRAAWSAS